MGSVCLLRGQALEAGLAWFCLCCVTFTPGLCFSPQIDMFASKRGCFIGPVVPGLSLRPLCVSGGSATRGWVCGSGLAILPASVSWRRIGSSVQHTAKQALVSSSWPCFLREGAVGFRLLGRWLFFRHRRIECHSSAKQQLFLTPLCKDSRGCVWAKSVLLSPW